MAEIKKHEINSIRENRNIKHTKEENNFLNNLLLHHFQVNCGY